MRVNINSCNSSGGNKPTLVDIGIGAAGSETILIPNLSAGGSGGLTITGGFEYWFPIYIKSGTRIAANARQNSTSGTNPYVWITLFGAPSCPSAIKVGSYVTSFGADTTVSGATSLTSGTTNEGAWTIRGSTMTVPHWGWQVGWAWSAATDVAWTAIGRFMDCGIGDGTSYKIAMENVMVSNYGTAEATGFQNLPACACLLDGKVGEGVYARMQNSSTAETGESMIVYGIGG